MQKHYIKHLTLQDFAAICIYEGVTLYVSGVQLQSYYKFNMIPSKRMKIFYLYLIKYMIILGFIVQCIEPAFAATKKRFHVTKPPKQTAVNITHLEEESAISTGNKYNYKMFIIALAVLVILSLPGAAVWFLYYRLKKKYGIDDVEKATEESQAKPSISGITTWFRLLYGKLREKNPVSGITAWLRLLYGKLRKKKPIYDEEKAIEKSQPKPTTSKTTLRSKGKKKKKKTKKKKAPVNKSVVEATVTPLTNQCTEEPVQSDQSPQALVQIAHSMPKENVGVTNVTEQQHTVPRGELSKEHTVESAKGICSKVRYKR
ncbi:uncharacterized protein LOC116410511 [Xenopus tropicalis]|uniref:Uncharacterized protein LOC116410511 n=1 Tax=Xenopus tropicalis TaxID=8364 RepID=A0A8J1JH60_XENTR|nr:uncharacterized protein LOC116410511 [Xenopus tropicalis]